MKKSINLRKEIRGEFTTVYNAYSSIKLRKFPDEEEKEPIKVLLQLWHFYCFHHNGHYEFDLLYASAKTLPSIRVLHIWNRYYLYYRRLDLKNCIQILSSMYTLCPIYTHSAVEFGTMLIKAIKRPSIKAFATVSKIDIKC